MRNTVGPGTTGSLLDRVISEGSAVAFEEEAFPRFANGYWDHVLSPSQEQGLWRGMRPQLDDSLIYQPRLLVVWFLGAGGVPHGTGYVIGYHIVKDYLARHPHASAAGLATVDAKTILSGSGYTG